MQLGKFKEYIESFPEDKVFAFGISNPFSWRGSYDEVCFSITQEHMTRNEVLKKINLALTESFTGRFGNYTYKEWDNVNFEACQGDFSYGEYTAKKIQEIEGGIICMSEEERLVKLAFK